MPRSKGLPGGAEVSTRPSTTILSMRFLLWRSCDDAPHYPHREAKGVRKDCHRDSEASTNISPAFRRKQESAIPVTGRDPRPAARALLPAQARSGILHEHDTWPSTECRL